MALKMSASDSLQINNNLNNPKNFTMDGFYHFKKHANNSEIIGDANNNDLLLESDNAMLRNNVETIIPSGSLPDLESDRLDRDEIIKFHSNSNIIGNQSNINTDCRRGDKLEERNKESLSIGTNAGNEIEDSITSPINAIPKSSTFSASNANSSPPNAVHFDNSNENNNQSKRKSLDYLKELFQDREKLQVTPLGMFFHVNRLIDQEILRVRASLIHIDGSAEQRKPLNLPKADGPIVQLDKRIVIPVDKYPEHNFVGRIIGPRGLTIRELEVDCGCKLYIRGRGSLRNKEKEDKCRGLPNWEHLNDDLHVLIIVEDSENRAQIKLDYAVEQINKLIESVILQKDDFKMRQLAELAILNDKFNTKPNAFVKSITPSKSSIINSQGSILDTALIVGSNSSTPNSFVSVANAASPFSQINTYPNFATFPAQHSATVSTTPTIDPHHHSMFLNTPTQIALASASDFIAAQAAIAARFQYPANRFSGPNLQQTHSSQHRYHPYGKKK
ncbi:Held out wings-like protein 1 [Sarcoptes scabiei]|uniref:Held out wings-like protein 1 n=1 Tax=Sarcoptes scabiei TaxID=52283 RepID=A0A132A5R7_SARSC|nr:Held out wings-like protein 1 [Sarcoptes scabiei]